LRLIEWWSTLRSFSPVRPRIIVSAVIGYSLPARCVVTATSVGAILVLFSYTTVLNGWDLGAMLVLLGCFYLVQGFGELVLQPSFEKFMEHVRLGTLDFALLKPVSAQFLVTLRNFQVVQLAQMGLGAAVVAIGLSRIPSIGVADFSLAGPIASSRGLSREFAKYLTCLSSGEAG